jgi:hypothetical protein
MPRRSRLPATAGQSARIGLGEGCPAAGDVFFGPAGATPARGCAIPIPARVATASARRRSAQGVQQSECSHAWRLTPNGNRTPPGVSDFAARGAAVRIGVGMSAIEELDDDDVVSGALGLRAWQSANPLDQIRFLLKKALPAGSFRRFSPEPILE